MLNKTLVVVVAVAVLALAVVSYYVAVKHHGGAGGQEARPSDVAEALRAQMSQLLALRFLNAVLEAMGYSEGPPHVAEALMSMVYQATEPYFIVIPPLLAPGDNATLDCLAPSISSRKVNETYYHLSVEGNGERITRYELSATGSGKLAYTLITSGPKGFYSSSRVLIVYKGAYRELIELNHTTRLPHVNITINAYTRIRYQNSIPVEILSQMEKKEATVLRIDPEHSLISVMQGDKNITITREEAEKIINILARLPELVRVDVINTTTTTINGSTKRVYQVHLLISIDTGQLGNASIGLKVEEDMKLVEAKPWLLVPQSIHVDKAVAWANIAGRHYQVDIANPEIPALCKPASS